MSKYLFPEGNLNPGWRGGRLTVPCPVCGQEFKVFPCRMGPGNGARVRTCGNPACTKEWRSQKLKREYESGKRVPPQSVQLNPEKAPERIAKMRETRQRLFQSGALINPLVFLGKGKPPRPSEMVLAERLLPLGWRFQFSVASGLWRGLPVSQRSGKPGNFMLDFALPNQKLYIEVDGSSHGRKPIKNAPEIDRRKDEILSGLGWCGLRLSEQEVLTDIEGALKRIANWREANSPSCKAG